MPVTLRATITGRNESYTGGTNADGSPATAVSLTLLIEPKVGANAAVMPSMGLQSLCSINGVDGSQIGDVKLGSFIDITLTAVQDAPSTGTSGAPMASSPTSTTTPTAA